MKLSALFAAAVLFSGTAAIAQTSPLVTAQPAAATAPARAAEIPFANHGGIFDWRADGTGAILIESLQRHYYRATFMAPCMHLPYTETIGFVTDPSDSLTKFDSIVVGHEHCDFQNMVEIPKPAGFPS